MTKRVLIVEDNTDVRAATLHAFDPRSCEVVAAPYPADAPGFARRHPVDLLVLGAVEAAGADASSLLRQAFRKPIVPLFRPSVFSRSRLNGVTADPGLMLGLADCRIRISQHLQSRATPSEVEVRWGEFTVRLEAGAFAFRGRGLDLTRAQGAILSLLMTHGGEVVSRTMIEDIVFAGKPRSGANLVAVHISRLRAKLDDRRSDLFIENVKGAGYALFWNRSFSSRRLPEAQMLTPAPPGGGAERLHQSDMHLD